MIFAVIDKDREWRARIRRCLEECCLSMAGEENSLVREYETFRGFADALPGEAGTVIADPGDPSGDGMEELRRIRMQDRNISIIIFTDHQDYALEGYTVGAFRYILKSREGAEKLLGDAVKCIAEMTDDCDLAVDMGDRNAVVHYRDIAYAECIMRSTYIHLISGKTVKIRNPIKEITEILCRDSRFVECYRDIAVNTVRIKRLDQQGLEMESGERLPVSRRRRAGLRRRMTELKRTQGCQQEFRGLPDRPEKSGT